MMSVRLVRKRSGAKTRRGIRLSILLIAIAIVQLEVASVGLAAPDETGSAAPSASLLAQADEGARETSGNGPLESRYPPREPEPKSWYNDSYIFGMTRGVAGSTMVPAAKVPLFVLTIPLDIVFLPFAAIGGLFG